MRFEARQIVSDLRWIDTAERHIAAAKARLANNPTDVALESLVYGAEHALERHRDRLAWNATSMCAATPNPHPALRDTFSRREKGYVL